MGQGNAIAQPIAVGREMTLRKRPDWISDDDWAAYVGGGKEPKSNGEKASEDTLAVRMAEVHAGSLVHATLLAKWFKLCKQGWEPEKTPVAFDLARNVCRAEAVTSIGSKLVAGVLKMCAADPRIAVPPEIFDADPWILNTMTGTVELKTGQLRPHRPDDYCTKWAPVGPGGECPMFHEFMRTIFAKDIELIAFLQRFFGYVLTGLTDGTRHAVLLRNRRQRQVCSSINYFRNTWKLPQGCADRHFHRDRR